MTARLTVGFLLATRGLLRNRCSEGPWRLPRSRVRFLPVSSHGPGGAAADPPQGSAALFVAWWCSADRGGRSAYHYSRALPKNDVRPTGLAAATCQSTRRPDLREGATAPAPESPEILDVNDPAQAARAGSERYQATSTVTHDHALSACRPCPITPASPIAL